MTCRECQTAKVVCPRKFNNIVRALAKELRESEDQVRSKHARFIAHSTQKETGKKDDSKVAKAKGKANERKANGETGGQTKGNGKEKEKLPKITIPGGRGTKSNKTRSERSNSRAPRDEMEDEDELEMNVDVPGTSKPQSQRSHLRVPHASGSQIFNECGSSPQVHIDAPGVSAPQSRCLDSQGPDANQKANKGILASKIAVEAPEPSKSELQNSHSQVSHAGDTLPTNEDDDTQALLMPKSSRFRSQIPDISLDLKREMWDDLSRAGLYEHLEAYEVHQTLSRQLLDDVTFAKDVLAAHFPKCADDIKELRTRMEVLVDGDDLLANLTREWTDATNQLKEARSEAEQAINQRLEAESELSELRGRMKDLEEEKNDAWYEVHELTNILQELQAEQQGLDEKSELRRKVKSLEDERDALKENHRVMDLLKEFQGLKEFKWGAPLDPQDRERDNEDSDRHGHSIGAQPTTSGVNPHPMASLMGVLTIQRRMLDKQNKQCEELERKAVVLKSELGEFSFWWWLRMFTVDPGKANRYSHLLSDYGAFARQVWITAYALQGVEASVSRETQFPCKAFRSLIHSLDVASTTAQERISAMEKGKFKIVGFIESDDYSSDGSCPPSPSQDKRGQKRKEREGDNDELKAQSRRRRD